MRKGSRRKVAGHVLISARFFRAGFVFSSSIVSIAPSQHLSPTILFDGLRIRVVCTHSVKVQRSHSLLRLCVTEFTTQEHSSLKSGEERSKDSPQPQWWAHSDAAEMWDKRTHLL